MASSVLDAADGQWPGILAALAGLTADQLSDKHQPCPACGGTDRYRWDRDDGPGGWFCNQCGGKDQRGGGGTGMDLLMRVTGLSFADAARRVEGHLGIATSKGGGGRAHRTPEKPPTGTAPPELGRAVAQWCYQDGSGDPLFWIQRFDRAGGGKLFVHRVWLDGGWHFPRKADAFTCDWPTPRPMYRLPVLARQPWADVLICEGEKATDAAARLFPEHAVVSWSNGSRSIGKVDWKPLEGRFVVLWPDADQAGADCMEKLAQLLLAQNCSVSIVAPPNGVPSGWDLADAVWTGAEALDHLKTFAVPVAPLVGVPGQPQPPPPAAAGGGGGGAPLFALLGCDEAENYYYQPRSTGRVTRLSRAGHTSTNLCSLAPLVYWESLYGSGRGAINWTLAVSDLFDQQHKLPMFNPDQLRGRGAWWDLGRSILHLGNRLIVDGVTLPITQPFESRYYYQRATELQGPGSALPLSDDEALEILMLAGRFHWDVPASSHLLAGWVTLAPICGALPWRPHVWLTAGAGAGKSTMLERFVGTLLTDLSLPVVGNSTEAFIRQALRSDALPVVMDEAEPNNPKDSARVQSILALARFASSETRATIGKGSASGSDVQRYRIRSMFLLSSISTALNLGADKRRFAQLTMRRPTELSEADARAHWEALDVDLDRIITPDIGARLIARTIGLIPPIRQSIKVFCRVAGGYFNSPAMGDQYGTLLAGAWHLQSSAAVTAAEALAWIEGSDWSSYQDSREVPDEQRCLQSLLAHQLRVEAGDRVVTRTIAELVDLVRAPSVSPMEPIAPSAAADLLSRHGLRVDDGAMVVSSSAAPIRMILRETPWADSWATVLMRLPGAQRCGATRFRGCGVVSKAVSVCL
jgi:putative DNA primase/helicase